MSTATDLKDKLDALVKAAVHFGQVRGADWTTDEDEKDAKGEVNLARYAVDRHLLMDAAERIGALKAVSVLGGSMTVERAHSEARAETAAFADLLNPPPCHNCDGSRVCKHHGEPCPRCRAGAKPLEEKP